MSIRLCWLCLLACWCAAAAEISVTLDPSIASPSLVGERISWTATVPDVDQETLWYRFRARAAGGEFRVIRDYGPSSSLDWTASENEGVYEMEVSARDRATGASATTTVVYEMLSRVTGDTPVINPTANPLVFLYSAPPCEDGGRMRVRFQSADGSTQSTPSKPCRTGVSMNFYLAGLRTETDYIVRHTVESEAGTADGPDLSLTAPEVGLDLPQRAVTLPSLTLRPSEFIVHSPFGATPFATDLEGRLVWFYPEYISLLTRQAPGGTFLGVVNVQGRDQSYQAVREFDLAGLTVQETNAARVNEHLAAMGKRPISGFHHEAVRLPDGKLLVLAAVEQILEDVQGPGPVDVIGEMILVLGRDLEVEWAWDSFDHMDPSRMALFGETCTPGAGGCPPFYLARRANDWLHANSLQLTPDGNILMSIRHLDWVIKIDYNHGTGNGAILWRLGKDGDFEIDSADPSPWFSHQHDAGFIAGSNTTLVVFDNGNTRRFTDDTANSRGQVLELDEEKRVARLVVNADLGRYTPALGSAQRLANGNYHFNAGFLLPDAAALSIEVAPSGEHQYTLRVAAPVYRSVRVPHLYTPF